MKSSRSSSKAKSKKTKKYLPGNKTLDKYLGLLLLLSTVTSHPPVDIKPMNAYIENIRSALAKKDYEQLADLLWIPILKNPPRPTSTAITELLSRPIQGNFHLTEKPLAEMLNFHLLLFQSVSTGSFEDAFKHSVSALQELLKNLTGESRQEVSLLKRLCSNVFYLAILVDRKKDGGNREEAARHLSRAFTTSITDRAPLYSSKKWASIQIANLLFRIYFRLGTIRLCHNIVRAIDTTAMTEFPPLSQFPKSEIVTYLYYRGRLSMNQGDFKKSEEYFQKSLLLCHQQFKSQRRELMIYFVLVKMIHGNLPHQELLHRHELESQFYYLSAAIRTGDLRLFDQILLANQSFYMQKEIFLLIQLQLRNLILRSFFKKVYLMGLKKGVHQENRLNLKLVEAALSLIGIPNTPLDDVECIAANLIFHVQIMPI
jgi:tetratricopeptide (TPR) repeat protein